LKPIPIRIKNNFNFSRVYEPVSIAIPLTKGEVFDESCLYLLDSDGVQQPIQICVLARWSDNSLKWLYVYFQVSIEKNITTEFQLVENQSIKAADTNPANQSSSLSIEEKDHYIYVQTGTAVFMLNKRLLQPFEKVTDHNGKLISCSNQILLTDPEGHVLKPVINSVKILGQDFSVFNKITLRGVFNSEQGDSHPEFTMVLSFFAGKSTVKCDFTVTNPLAARHNKGVWDLGDSGSFFFDSLCLRVPLLRDGKDIISNILTTPAAKPVTVDNFSVKLYQESSGGINWQSINHVNRDRVSKHSFKGYRFYVDDNLESEGNRANPIFNINSNTNNLSTYMLDFWQNFPKCLAIEDDSLWVKFFPDEFSDCYELQGGEQKSHHFYLDFNSELSDLLWCANPLEVKLSPESYSNTKCIPQISGSYKESSIQKLIQRGIKGSQNFYEKREVIDEYGWRNYGEIYADHELHEYKGKDQLISHYNNQYDALYGLLKQYLLTGNNEWYNLAAPLALHVVDIDIYHTTRDRDEYNGGLFWHTDHYLSAHTCTHRTYSIHHTEDYLYGETGGGPGAEHCYTLGLTYFYFLTNEEIYKESVLLLTNWMIQLHEGSGTILEKLFQFKSNDLPILKKLFAGEKVQKYKYPFTRGTGNFITSLLDAYTLTGDVSYLERVEKIIPDTLHPKDIIEMRQLGNIESNWSYLILLQAITRYLEVKIHNEKLDENFIYARDCLIHYVDWIADNETPFLNNPEKLEYPNHTWVAQDIRKANLLYTASFYNLDRKEKYLVRADEFVSYISKTLEIEETRYYARILIILMQNDLNWSDKTITCFDNRSLIETQVHYESPPMHSVIDVLLNFTKDLAYRVLRFSWKKEKRWLSYRLNS
jgi:hypothetical protein